MHRTNFRIGDIVYLFMSDERKVAFKTRVIDEGCKRTDTPYWVVKPSSHLTYILELVWEYKGDKLTEGELVKYGFKGGRSIQHPMKNNTELLKYIDGVFDTNGKDIPKEVMEIADACFCGVIYVGVFDGKDVYGEKPSDEYPPEPTGLPSLILWDGEKTEIVSGIESLDILSHIE